MKRNLLPACLAAALIACAGLGTAAPASTTHGGRHHEGAPTATPIKHLVVIFQENVSFDHYFATYPVAANPAGEPAFHARPGTPAANGLSGMLLTANPNKLNPLNGAGAVNPFRLDRSQAATADQDHDYTAEQMAFDGGKMDLFPAATGAPSTDTGLVMGYYTTATPSPRCGTTRRRSR